jgi:hypothetical protein
MARAPKLKVYRTAAGFHDAYVAAASQKAALAAWGSEHDLFARGIAELVTDPALTAEPLASPGTVIKRSRGSAAEQIASLPPQKPRPAPAETAAPATGRTRAKPEPAKRKPPKPDKSAVESAEEALEALTRDHEQALRALAKREAELARERRALEREQASALRKMQADRDAARDAYDSALKTWRAAR